VSANYDFLDPSIDRRLAADIDTAESDRLVAYLDTEGNWTCGRGHLMPPAAPGRSWKGFTVIQSTSDGWFNTDLLAATALAKRWPEFQKCDTTCRQNALIEIAFNLGGKWSEFVHARAAIEAQNWPEVKAQLLDSKWATQVHGRASRIANYFLTGEYPNGSAP
jgi:GH24 family phage-related lysozyme (muramidase)